MPCREAVAGVSAVLGCLGSTLWVSEFDAPPLGAALLGGSFLACACSRARWRREAFVRPFPAVHVLVSVWFGICPSGPIRRTCSAIVFAVPFGRPTSLIRGIRRLALCHYALRPHRPLEWSYARHHMLYHFFSFICNALGVAFNYTDRMHFFVLGSFRTALFFKLSIDYYCGVSLPSLLWFIGLSSVGCTTTTRWVGVHISVWSCLHFGLQGLQLFPGFLVGYTMVMGMGLSFHHCEVQSISCIGAGCQASGAELN